MYHPFAFNKQDIRRTPSITESTIDFLVVGGGGAGGYRTGGGGGAGGYITSAGQSGGGQSGLAPFTASIGVAYQIYIGAGGAAFNTDAPSLVTIGKGSDTRFDAYYAEGGGRGGSGNNISGTEPVKAHIDGQPGGSGGGGGSWQYNALLATGSGGTGSAYYGGPYGYNGGSGSVGTAFRRGGGGGGAAAVGQDALTGNSTSVVGANGGSGLNTGPEQTPIYRAGGGGGGASTTPNPPTTASYGGLGGGGNGGTTGFSAGNGIDSTGGGGGGGGASSYIVGGTGGSGVIVLRYNRNQITASVTAGITASEEIPGGGVFKVLTITEGGTAQYPEYITFTPI